MLIQRTCFVNICPNTHTHGCSSVEICENFAATAHQPQKARVRILIIIYVNKCVCDAPSMLCVVCVFFLHFPRVLPQFYNTPRYNEDEELVINVNIRLQTFLGTADFYFPSLIFLENAGEFLFRRIQTDKQSKVVHLEALDS